MWMTWERGALGKVKRLRVVAPVLGSVCLPLDFWLFLKRAVFYVKRNGLLFTWQCDPVYVVESAVLCVIRLVTVVMRTVPFLCIDLIPRSVQVFVTADIRMQTSEDTISYWSVSDCFVLWVRIITCPLTLPPSPFMNAEKRISFSLLSGYLHIRQRIYLPGDEDAAITTILYRQGGEKVGLQLFVWKIIRSLINNNTRINSAFHVLTIVNLLLHHLVQIV